MHRVATKNIRTDWRLLAKTASFLIFKNIMKDLLKTITILFGIALIIWAIGFTAPKIIDIYKNKPMEIKTDTIVYTDTLYLEATKTDTLPKTVYQTIVEKDTLYKVIGDSIEAQPRVVLLKKKLSRTPLTLKDKILYHYSTQHQ